MSAMEAAGRQNQGAGSKWPRRSLAALVVLATFLWSTQGAKVDPAQLFGADGRASIAKFVAGLFPPDLSLGFLLSLVRPAIETVQIAIAGVLIGAVVGFPLSFLATRTLGSSQTPGVGAASRWFLGHLPYQLARNFLNFMRAVPELVWALVFAVHSAGLLGKLYAEAMESIDLEPVEAVRALGGNRMKATAYAVLPQAAPHFVSLTLYQWECNVRTATILGFVGAGGIGQSIDIAMRLFQYNELLTLMVIVFFIVFLVDNASALIRKALIPRAS
ncbi:MAG: phosphate/phosphonate ABC transporter permease [Chloroflexi bacterium]|nr:phosphate/phosphonate ABC transporter permease [Chloroflexota bacterium]